METTGIWPIKECVGRWQAKIMEYVAWRPMNKLCTGAEKMEGHSMSLRWWNQYLGPNQTKREV